MSRTTPTLNIEWTPGRVRALDLITGKEASGVSLGDLGPILAGHRDALVGIGRGATFLKTVALPKAAPAELRALLQVRLGQLFPLPADQLAFDFVQTDTVGPDGVETLVVAMRATDLKQLQTELAQANLKADRILPAALSAPLVAGQKDALVVERGPLGISLDVVQDGTVRLSRSAPADADGAQEVRRTLAAAGLESLPVIESVDTLRKLADAPALTFELSEDREKAARKKVQDRTRFGVLLLASGLLLAALIWADRGDEYAKVRKSEGTWDRNLSKLRSIKDLETKKAQAATGLETTLKQAFEPGQHLSDAITVLGESLPQGVWLTGLTVERGKPFQIRGTAHQTAEVAGLVESMSANRRFRDVKLVFANEGKIKDTKIVQFNLTAFPVGNLPMPEPPKKTKKKAAPTK
ncbi:MAG: PilN domain-containing protein [Armatimonas sp.]